MRLTSWQNLMVFVLFGTTTVLQADELLFERDIAPILEEHCWHCHGQDEQESGLRLDRRAGMLRGGDSGLAALVPGDVDNSYLIEVINHLDEEMAMPPDEDKIPEEQITLLTTWVKQGAVWPGQMKAVAREKSDHWSFQPVQRPTVPNGGKRVGNPIDAFLVQKLVGKNLSFSAKADPRTLLRRAAIVLTGLPPIPAVTAQFVSDWDSRGNEAYIDAVERLLASPHFGERWAQHWLDV
ncbi:MAG: DUF1549 domain-containing protein, partial [Rubripirellula sp.]